MAAKHLIEGDYAGEFLVGEYDPNHCRDNITVTGPLKRNQVVAVAGEFVGIVFDKVPAGVTKKVGAVVRGPVEVSLAKLAFPEAPDGADSGTDNVAETASLRADLLADMKAVGIVVRA